MTVVTCEHSLKNYLKVSDIWLSDFVQKNEMRNDHLIQEFVAIATKSKIVELIYETRTNS